MQLLFCFCLIARVISSKEKDNHYQQRTKKQHIWMLWPSSTCDKWLRAGRATPQELLLSAVPLEPCETWFAINSAQSEAVFFSWEAVGGTETNTLVCQPWSTTWRARAFRSLIVDRMLWWWSGSGGDWGSHGSWNNRCRSDSCNIQDLFFSFCSKAK